MSFEVHIGQSAQHLNETSLIESGLLDHRGTRV